MPAVSEPAAAIAEPARQTPVLGDYEVVVVGGGPAGITAAAAAARSGRSTILIERYGYLGGAGTAGGLSTFCGLHANVHGEHRRVIRGLADDLLDRLDRPGRAERAAPVACDRIAPRPSTSPRTRSRRTSLSPARRHAALPRDGDRGQHDGGDRIGAVFVESKSGRHAIRGQVFIDCSGDGDLAGLVRRAVRESTGPGTG